MTGELGVGIVGFGHIAPRHVEAIHDTPGLALRGVCDVVPERAERAGADLQVPWTVDYEQMLEAPDIDVVALCTPNHLHVSMARLALDAGKHTVVEKPISFSAHEALALNEAFERAGLGLFCVLQVRFNPAVEAVRALIEGGGLGRIYIGSLAQRWNRRDEYFEGPDAWHGIRALEGGSLYTQGVHYIDLLTQLIGPVEEITARMDTLAHSIETEDAVVATLRYACGAMGSLEFSLDSFERNIEASITLLAEKGNITLGGTAANELALWNVASQRAPEGIETVVPNDYGGRYCGSPPNHGSIYRNVAAHLGDAAEPIAVTAASAAESIRVIEAIYESAASGRPVHISHLAF